MTGVFVSIIMVANYTTNIQIAFANDVWISSTDNGMETYIVEETIKPDTHTSHKSFTVTIKKVQNGKLRDTTSIAYMQDGVWKMHYERGHGWTSVAYKDEIFEYCMNHLGWKYKLTNIGRSSDIYVYD